MGIYIDLGGNNTRIITLNVLLKVHINTTDMTHTHIQNQRVIPADTNLYDSHHSDLFQEPHTNRKSMMFTQFLE